MAGLEDLRRLAPNEITSKSEDDISEKDLASKAIDLCGILIENVACHPFLVLRRQCQVSDGNLVRSFHLTPITLFPVMLQIQRNQGFSAYWKGFDGVLSVKGFRLLIQDLIHKFTNWPKEIRDGRSAFKSMERLGQHLLLKTLSYGLITPLIPISLMDTVQSNIVKDSNPIRGGILESISEVFSRLWHNSGRILPIWILMPPTIVHGLAHYTIQSLSASVLYKTVIKLMRRRQASLQGAISKDNEETNRRKSYYCHITYMLGQFIADATLFPFETVLCRLYLQGTRSIIDNVDNGEGVIPVMTRYTGVMDCWRTIKSEEGSAGLFKGFGALILQYGLYFTLLHVSNIIVREVHRVIQEEQRETKKEK